MTAELPRWPERQLAMLREMGVQHFWPLAPTEQAQPVRAPVPPPSPEPSAAARPMSTNDVQRVPAAREPRLAAPVAAPPVAPSSAPAVLGHRPEGVAEMGWFELRQAVSGCEACGLCKGRRQTVFGVGHEQARWMLVGEAPGEQEDRMGEPFVGPAGQLLDRMLTAVGLTRSEAPPEQQVYIANVIKCRPPGNRNPVPEEVAQCEPFLIRQVQLVQPKLILAMGRFAVQSLLKSTEPIGKLRGRVHDYHGVPLVVTYHPAYLLRQPADKALAWDDLCLARELMARG
jgi:uracil-DNA glycosylase